MVHSKESRNPIFFLGAAERMQLSSDELVIFEDSKAGVLAAERAGAGKIYIVNSIDDDFSTHNHEIIYSFDQVDRSLFLNFIL